MFNFITFSTECGVKVLCFNSNALTALSRSLPQVQTYEKLAGKLVREVNMVTKSRDIIQVLYSPILTNRSHKHINLEFYDIT